MAVRRRLAGLVREDDNQRRQRQQQQRQLQLQVDADDGCTKEEKEEREEDDERRKKELDLLRGRLPLLIRGGGGDGDDATEDLGLNSLAALLSAVEAVVASVGLHGASASPPPDIVPFLDDHGDDEDIKNEEGQAVNGGADDDECNASRLISKKRARVLENVRSLREEWAEEVGKAKERAAAAAATSFSGGGGPRRPLGGSNSLNLLVKGSASSKDELKVRERVQQVEAVSATLKIRLPGTATFNVCR